MEGCSFHFARAGNTNRDELGLRKFTKMPALRDLLEHLQAVNARSLGKLIDYEQHTAAEIRLKLMNVRRREKVSVVVERFRVRLLQEEELTTREVKRCCRRME